MGEQEDFDAAYAEVFRQAQANMVPKLEDYEVFNIVKECKQAVYWQAGATLMVGPLFVQPPARTGHAYRVLVGGVAGASSPFSTTNFPAIVYDGDVQLADIGFDFSNIFDIRRAVGKAWALKMAKSSEFINSSDGDERAIFENCKSMADAYRTPMVC